jgi:hypothetical protein
MSQRDCQRCQATKVGTQLQCKKRTCMSATYCYIHLKILEGLRIKPSNIPNAGYGLFTTRDRQKNEKLDDYIRPDGPYMRVQTREEIDAEYGENTAPYVWCGRKNRCWNAKSTQSNWASKANSCDYPGNRKKCTGVIKETGALRTLTKLNAGDEILIRYGRQYYT